MIVKKQKDIENKRIEGYGFLFIYSMWDLPLMFANKDQCWIN